MFPPSVIDLSGSFGNRLLNGRFAPFKQSRTADDETGEQGCYTSEGSTALKPGKSIDRERSWPSARTRTWFSLLPCTFCTKVS
jgi:hypothetical protein